MFANFNGWLALFIVVTAGCLGQLPRLTRFVISTLGHRVSEPEVKFIFLILFLLGALAKLAGSEAVLPAYLVGLVIAGVFVRDRVLVDRMRATAFLAVKIAAKFIGVWPLTRHFKFDRKEGAFTTLLMSTGLTFGSISAVFGLTNHIITQEQYTILVTAVIGSAVVPTLIAQRFFLPGTPSFETTEEHVEIFPEARPTT